MMMMEESEWERERERERERECRRLNVLSEQYLIWGNRKFMSHHPWLGSFYDKWSTSLHTLYIICSFQFFLILCTQAALLIFYRRRGSSEWVRAYREQNILKYHQNHPMNSLLAAASAACNNSHDFPNLFPIFSLLIALFIPYLRTIKSLGLKLPSLLGRHV